MRKEEKSLKTWLEDFKLLDPFFIQLTLALTLLGLMFAFSSSTYESFRISNNFWSLGLKQLIAFGLGLTLMIFLQKMNYKFWYHSCWSLTIVISIIMVVTVCTPLGKTSGGSTRWIDLGIFQFQPAEVAKFIVILLIAKLVTKHKWFEFKSYLPYIGSILFLIFIIFKQPDLGSAAILFIVFLEMIFIFEWPIWILFLGSVLTVIAAYVKISLTPYQFARIQYWLNPYLDPQGKGYNLIQAKYALAAGGLWGVGLGNSLQKKGYLPIPHSDFIIAVISEEIGFLGMTAILILYASWILRGLYLTNKVSNRYGRILSTAIMLLIATQASVNIAVAVGLLPVTGVTLPFFSCGGTSLIVTLAMCGVLFNILNSEVRDER